jgi:hypothetical protein
MMANDYRPFDFSGLTEHQEMIIREAIDRTTFNFPALIPGLEAQVRRQSIPVLFSDLSRFQVRKHGGGHDTPDDAHTITRTIDARRQVLGLAYYMGKVVIEQTLESRPALAMEVFLAEGAHMVDFFFMTPEHREKVFALYHQGDLTAHDHGWFEETGNDDYWSWVGESFMYGFIAAFSTIPGTDDNFTHQTTPVIGAQIRLVLQPPNPIIRRIKSTIVHRLGSWHERQINDAFQESFASLSAAEAFGFRKCKTCRWEGL